MCHGDDSGLVLPPAIAPIQAVIIPVAMHKAGVLEKAEALAASLKQAGMRVKLDVSDQTPGWKFAEYEMKGVPLRIEIGPRDIAANQCVIVDRINREKKLVALDQLRQRVLEELDTFAAKLYEKPMQTGKHIRIALHHWRKWLTLQRQKADL